MSFNQDYHNLLCLKTIKSVGMQRQSRSSASFQRLQCLSTKTIIVFFASRLSSPLVCRDNQGHLPLFKDFNVFQPRLSQSSLPQRLSSLLACRDNQGHLPLFEDFNVFRPRLSQSSLPQDYQVCWPVETIKVICLFSNTSLSFDQDYHRVLCLRDHQVCWLAETIIVICFLYIFKTIKVCRHAETIMVICFLYFSKTIKVCCLAETINVFRPLHFQRPSESFVSKTIRVFC